MNETDKRPGSLLSGGESWQRMIQFQIKTIYRIFLKYIIVYSVTDIGYD